MWTYVQTWIVQDDVVPELRVGDRLALVGVRAKCSQIHRLGHSESLPEVHDMEPDEQGFTRSRLTGTVKWSRKPNAALIRVGPFDVIAEPDTYREVRGPDGDNRGYKPYSADFRVPPIGSSVSLVANLEIMPSYEYDASGFPDVRRDWTVRRIRVEHWSPEEPVGVHRWRTGRVVRVEEIEAMDRWGDEDHRYSSAYLIDLLPAT